MRLPNTSYGVRWLAAVVLIGLGFLVAVTLWKPAGVLVILGFAVMPWNRENGQHLHNLLRRRGDAVEK